MDSYRTTVVGNRDNVLFFATKLLLVDRSLSHLQKDSSRQELWARIKQTARDPWPLDLRTTHDLDAHDFKACRRYCGEQYQVLPSRSPRHELFVQETWVRCAASDVQSRQQGWSTKFRIKLYRALAATTNFATMLLLCAVFWIVYGLSNCPKGTASGKAFGFICYSK